MTAENDFQFARYYCAHCFLDAKRTFIGEYEAKKHVEAFHDTPYAAVVSGEDFYKGMKASEIYYSRVAEADALIQRYFKVFQDPKYAADDFLFEFPAYVGHNS